MRPFFISIERILLPRIVQVVIGFVGLKWLPVRRPVDRPRIAKGHVADQSEQLPLQCFDANRVLRHRNDK